jgi:thiamine kinase
MEQRRLFAQGREAEVFLEPDGRVLKLLREASFEPRVHREAAALRAVRGAGHLAPEAFGVVTVDGRPGLLMERLSGEDLLTILGRGPQRVLTAGRVMGEAHALMHECPAPAELPDLAVELRQRIQDAPPLPDDLRAAALAMIDRLPSGDALCHGDLHLGNIIGSFSASVVIDWGDASRGDPLADVARTVLLHRFGELPPGSPALLRAAALVGRRALVARYLHTYRRRHPVDRRQLSDWVVVRAAARLCEPIPEEHPRLLRFLQRRLRAG